MMCVSLFSYQGSLPFSSDSFDSLSYSKLFVKNFLFIFQLFWSFFAVFLSSHNFFTLSHSFLFVKNFLGFFQIHFCDIRNESSDSFQTEKEGFEPSRRANDLHP